MKNKFIQNQFLIRYKIHFHFVFKSTFWALMKILVSSLFLETSKESKWRSGGTRRHERNPETFVLMSTVCLCARLSAVCSSVMKTQKYSRNVCLQQIELELNLNELLERTQRRENQIGPHGNLWIFPNIVQVPDCQGEKFTFKSHFHSPNWLIE